MEDKLILKHLNLHSWEINQISAFTYNPKFFVLIHSFLRSDHQSIAKPLRTYLYGNQPYPLSPHPVPQEFLVSSAQVVSIPQLSLLILILSSNPTATIA